MTPCPDPARLAAAASGEDLGAERHAADCRTCRDALDAALALRTLASRLPPITLTAERRRALEASVLAIADRDVPPAPRAPRHRRRLIAVALAGAAAALAIAAAVARSRMVPAPTPAPTGATAPTASAVDVVPLADDHRPRRADDEGAPSIVADPDARFERRIDARRETVVLRDGTIAIDARGATQPTELVGTGDAVPVAVRIDGAHVEVRASRGAIRTVRVFAGSVEIVSAGKTVVVTEGATWQVPATTFDAAARAPRRDPPRAPAAAADARTPPSPTFDAATRAAAAAFADGWTALHAADPAAAASLFHRAAADPGIAEDARYWLAVAHHRAGDIDTAIAAYDAFLTAHEASPHAGAAHLALGRLLSRRDPARAAVHRAHAAADPDPRVRAAAAAAAAAATDAPAVPYDHDP